MLLHAVHGHLQFFVGLALTSGLIATNIFFL